MPPRPFVLHERKELKMANDKDTVVVTSGGSAGWFFALLAVIALLVFGYFVFNGYFGGSEQVSVELSVPEELTPNQ